MACIADGNTHQMGIHTRWHASRMRMQAIWHASQMRMQARWHASQMGMHASWECIADGNVDQIACFADGNACQMAFPCAMHTCATHDGVLRMIVVKLSYMMITSTPKRCLCESLRQFLIGAAFDVYLLCPADDFDAAHTNQGGMLEYTQIDTVVLAATGP